MLERGMEVYHTTIYRWVQHYARVQIPEDGVCYHQRV